MATSVDTSTLTSMISTLVDDSMDGRFSPAQQQQCMVLAKRLRGTLMNLLSARFNDGTPQVVQANSDLNTVNNQIQVAATNLGAFAQTLANVTSLVGQLDSLLALAAKFA
jgi:hypothetical protein